MKPLTLAVCITIIAALLIGTCGCTSSNQTSNQTPIASQSAAAQRNTLLQNYLAAYKNQVYSNNNLQITRWELDWVNNTAATLQLTELNKTSNQTTSVNATYEVFPTTQDATNYVNAMNLTGFGLSTVYPGAGSYQNATGHAPQTYKQYELDEGNQHIVITQIDNLITDQLIVVQT